MTFDVRPGELFGFVGSNGAGKTTTMRIIMGVIAADAGSVRFDGRPVDLVTRRRIGYMPEERGLYPRMKVGAQLQYFARLHGFSDFEASAAAQLWMMRLGIEQRADDDVLKLSLGNQQRVQLATALVHNPDVLVLDEPFSGLDPVAVDVMSSVLRERSADKGSPVLFSSHQLDLVERLCDRVGIVRNGTMVACGAVDELRGRGPALIAIDAPGLDDDWITRMPGVSVDGREESRWVLRLEDHVDDHLVLATALAAGPVREFGRVQPTLTDLFRDATVDSTVDDATVASVEAAA
ncbi:ABC transporter ATP-binding protein [Nocardia iowensis]|uniref:ATP-binding cassette domain-containing protein n=1 Tax=Nocardia iowensis TaxID=204891 RepID=A0ABX8S272_NOCIO|nr:ATP-binding cassette domain-containing protein [Nocardia iowensis]QXN95307.1 ATP-binding cassette domain-containing protein [Nocardia iowensis]